MDRGCISLSPPTEFQIFLAAANLDVKVCYDTIHSMRIFVSRLRNIAQRGFNIWSIGVVEESLMGPNLSGALVGGSVGAVVGGYEVSRSPSTHSDVFIGSLLGGLCGAFVGATPYTLGPLGVAVTVAWKRECSYGKTKSIYR